MHHTSPHTIPDLKSVLERRDAWLQSVGEVDNPQSDADETPFVRSVIERCRKLQYELAADQFFAGSAPHDDRR